MRRSAAGGRHGDGGGIGGTCACRHASLAIAEIKSYLRKRIKKNIAKLLDLK